MRIITNNLRLFWQGTLLSYIALFVWLRPTTYIASKVLMPLAQILFFSFLGSYASGGTNVDFYVIGNAIQIVAVSGIFGVTLSIGGDRWNGTLPYLFGTPANRMMLFFGRAFMHIFDGALGVVIALGWGALLFGLDFSQTDLFALGITILVTTISTCGLGLMMGCLSLITANVMFVNNTVYFLLLIFSGANIVLETFPNWMQIISQMLPLTRGIASARLLISGSSLAEVTPLVLGELGIGIIYGWLGFYLFKWVENQAKRKGTLDLV